MTVINGPFQALDEVGHFERAVQISEGRFLPVRSPSQAAAGNYLDSSIDRIGGYYSYLAYRRGHVSFGSGPADTRAVWSTGLTRRRSFANFSNTAIYFPLAYALPAAGIAVARALHAPPIEWLYVGRIINVLVALMLFAAAIRLFPPLGLFVLVLALMPRVMSGTASLSADAVLIPVSCLFAALAGRLTLREELSPALTVLLGLCAFYICVIKIAYLPLAVVSPLISGLRWRKRSSTFLVLCAFSLVTVAVWFIWSVIIKNEVFSIRSDVHVDIYGQLHLMMKNPLRFLNVLTRTLHDHWKYYITSLPGDFLSPSAVPIPGVMSLVYVAFLVLSACIWQQHVRQDGAVFLIVLGLGMASCLAVFVLLYMQYTSLGASSIEGVQGRYFIPVLPVLAAVAGKRRVPVPALGALSAVVICWLFFGEVYTLQMMKARFWDSVAAPNERFAGSNHHNMDRVTALLTSDGAR